MFDLLLNIALLVMIFCMAIAAFLAVLSYGCYVIDGLFDFDFGEWVSGKFKAPEPSMTDYSKHRIIVEKDYQIIFNCTVEQLELSSQHKTIPRGLSARLEAP